MDSKKGLWWCWKNIGRPALDWRKKGYLGTGCGADSTLKDFWEYDPLTDLWTQKSDFGGAARMQAVGFRIGNKGYIGTGQPLSKDFWEYDPSNDTWKRKADFGGTARGQATGFSIGNTGYIGTGFGQSYKKDFWMYTPDVCNGLTVYKDADGDSYGNIKKNLFVADCIVPTGYVLDSTDCDDTNASIHPGISETTGDGIDNNCNGLVDENNALSFDGVDDYVEGNIATLPLGNSPRTLEAWIKTSMSGYRGLF